VGRSVSEEVESRIERLTAFERALGDLKKLEELARSNLEGALRQANWIVHRDVNYGGKIFIPPGQVIGLPQSGFIDRNEAEEPRPAVAKMASFKEALGQIVKEAVRAAIQEERANADVAPIPAVEMKEAAEDALREIVKESVRKVVVQELAQVVKEQLAHAGIREDAREHYASGR
jgi:hypothetical protein